MKNRESSKLSTGTGRSVARTVRKYLAKRRRRKLVRSAARAVTESGRDLGAAAGRSAARLGRSAAGFAREALRVGAGAASAAGHRIGAVGAGAARRAASAVRSLIETMRELAPEVRARVAHAVRSVIATAGRTITGRGGSRGSKARGRRRLRAHAR